MMMVSLVGIFCYAVRVHYTNQCWIYRSLMATINEFNVDADLERLANLSFQPDMNESQLLDLATRQRQE